MHEASLINNVLNIAEENLLGYRVKKINSLTLCVGVFSGAMEDALYAAFEAASKEGLFKGAELKIKSLPARVQCSACGNIDEIKKIPYKCSVCGGEYMELLSGQELYLESLDFDEEDE